jgi:hypothetical protein
MVRIRLHSRLCLLNSNLPVSTEEIHQLDSRYTASLVSTTRNVIHGKKTTYTASPAVRPNHKPANFHPNQNAVLSDNGNATK